VLCGAQFSFGPTLIERYQIIIIIIFSGFINSSIVLTLKINVRDIFLLFFYLVILKERVLMSSLNFSKINVPFKITIRYVIDHY
jgi:hypothetical protein